MKKETTAVYSLSEETARARPSDYLSQATYVRRRLRQPTFVRVAFGIIWSVDAWFKWQTEFQRGFFTLVQTGAANQPGWLEPWYQFWEMVLQLHASLYVVCTAVIEVIISAALIVGFARKPLYLFGALWSLSIWAIPEGFGNTSRAAHTDVGPSITHVMVFAALWALDSCTGPRDDSLDALIERRFPRWKRIAEVSDSRYC